MKKSLRYFLLLIALGLFIGPLIQRIPGFVLIAYGSHTLELRLWFAVVLWLFSVFALCMLWRLVCMPSRFLRWVSGKENGVKRP